jgi:hypothetical protein
MNFDTATYVDEFALPGARAVTKSHAPAHPHADPHAGGDPDAPLAVFAAALDHLHDCRAEGTDPTLGLHALLDLLHDPERLREVVGEESDDVHKAAKWESDKHPRDDRGRFVSREAIHAAKSDPKKAKELRKRVTDPAERKKLDAAIAGETDTGRTQAGLKKEAAQKRRETRQLSVKEVQRLTSAILLRPDLATPEQFAALIPHLDKLTVAELRNARVKLGASWRAQRLRRAEMVERLKEFAASAANDLRPSAEVHPKPGDLFSAGRRAVIGKDKEQAKKDRAAERRRLQKRGTDTVLKAVIAFGGIDPHSHALLGSYGSMKEALGDNIPMAVFRKGGRGLDQLAQELQTAGHIQIPENRDPGEYVLDLLKARAYSLTADLSEEYESAYQEYARTLQEASAHDERSEVEGARSRGSETGRNRAAADPVGEHGAGAGGPQGEVTDDGYGGSHGDSSDMPAGWLDDDPPSPAAAVQGEIDAHKTAATSEPTPTEPHADEFARPSAASATSPALAGTPTPGAPGGWMPGGSTGRPTPPPQPAASLKPRLGRPGGGANSREQVPAPPPPAPPAPPAPADEFALPSPASATSPANAGAPLTADRLADLYERAASLNDHELPALEDIAAVPRAELQRAGTALGLVGKVTPAAVHRVIRDRWGMARRGEM